jgi:hypothetical protein
MSAADLEDEYVQVLSAYQYAPSEETAIKLSLLLSNPVAPFYDLDRAIRLLDDAAIRLEAGGDPMAPLPRLLDQLLIERREVARRRNDIADELQSEQERSESLEQQLARTRSDLADERKQRETLQGQLDALRALEEQINDDDPGR